MDAVCYGFSLFGQLRSDEFNTVLSQFKSSGSPESLKSVRSIAFGWSRCYIIFEDGAVFLLGFSDSVAHIREPVKFPFQSSVKKIACMRRHDLFLTEDGSCWKHIPKNEWIKLDNLIPATMKKTDFQISDIISSDDLHLAVSNEGHLFSFPSCIATPFPAKVKKAACGFEHSVCLLENGSVFVWGSGSRGQLGNGSLNTAEQPELLIPLDGLVVIDIGAGGWHSAAVTISGDLYTWGWNNVGQLGLSSEEDTSDESDESSITVLSEPQPISYFDDSSIFKEVACGTNHTLVLMDDGLVWGCGSNKYGQINPASERQCFRRMTRVPLPEKTETVKRIYCASWNSVIFISCKN